METLTTTFVIPDWISSGLANGAYERMGGVIREARSKQVVAWLREGFTPEGNSLLPLERIPIQGMLSITSAASILNLGVSVIGFAVIAHRLNDLEQRLQ